MCKTCGCDQGQKVFWQKQNGYHGPQNHGSHTQEHHSHNGHDPHHVHDHDHDHIYDHNHEYDHENPHPHDQSHPSHDPDHRHDQDHHHHPHSHHPELKQSQAGEAHFYKRSVVSSEKISIQDSLLSENDRGAAQNRQFFADNNIITLNLMSSPGTGKTSLLTRTLIELKNSSVKVASIVGDQTTDLDADRLKQSGTWVHQINTYSSCHLDAKHIQQSLPLLPEKPHILFIENVGNLVCPAAFDLGEQIKVALISCTEGEDKVLKYPVLFHLAHIVLLTKTDLLPHLQWNQKLFRQNLKKINPTARFFELSSQTGDGFKEWIGFLRDLVEI